MAVHLLTPPRLHPSSSAPLPRLRASASLAHPLLLSRLATSPRLRIRPRPRRAMSATVRSSLIDPDGGAIVDLVAPPDLRAALRAEAEALPRVRLGPVDVEWAHVLAEGWASPLRGFMREHEYLQCLHFNCIRLPDGGGLVNMSLPIVLAIGDREKEDIGDKPDVALVGPSGDLLAILRRTDVVTMCGRRAPGVIAGINGSIRREDQKIAEVQKIADVRRRVSEAELRIAE